MERNCALSLHLGVVSIEKGAFGSPSTMVVYITYIYIYIYIHVCWGVFAHALSLNIEHRIDDLQGVINDKDGRQQRIRELCTTSTI